MTANILSGVRWHSDDGHAWLEVPLDSCDGVKVSAYSYKDETKGLAYLEEDCDAGAWVRHHGLTYVEFREAKVPSERWYGDCFVRELPRFREVVS